MHSMSISLHHFEVCVRDLSFINLLVDGYGFEKWIERKTNQYHQYVLRNNYCIFIVTNRLNNAESITKELNAEDCPNSTNFTYPALYCCENLNKHVNDAVFNVALEVKNINTIIPLIKIHGGQVLQEEKVIKDEYGTIKYAIVVPPCKNLIHTLIEKQNYNRFLPGFDPSLVDNADVLIRPKCHSMIEYIDHVTYVTEPGESTRLLKWYEDIFKMKRLFTNRKETEADGFVLGDLIGLRLKALRYWRCAETGVSPPGDDSPDQLKIVIAEPLPEVETSHVQEFINENGGPGIQHIGFHTDSIIDSVTNINKAGVKFRIPPYTYYEEIIEKEEIKDTGIENCLEKLEKLGILIDFEEGHQSVNYLMQIFSYPVFEKDTFFLEVIQRKGASGFGSGNIRALARSVIRYQQEMQKSIEKGHNIENKKQEFD